MPVEVAEVERQGRPARSDRLRFRFCIAAPHHRGVATTSCQYLSIRYTDRLADAGIDPSVGSVGDSYDALAESVIGLYKTKVIRRRGPWPHLEAVEFATLEWVDWFNYRRLLAPIGHVPPAECEQQYYLTQEAPVMEAGVN